MTHRRYVDIERLLAATVGIDQASLAKGMVGRAVHRRMEATGCATAELYMTLVASTPEELQALTEEVVVLETWFFRDHGAFEYLVHYIHHDWLPRRNHAPLRMLCVPCATGEEAYSLAMILLDAGLEPDAFVVDAIDISEYALDVAREGVYLERAFRRGKVDMPMRYLHRFNGGMQVIDPVRAAVNFRWGNILDPSAWAGQRPYNVIFCRNLLIYFEQGAQQRAMERLAALVAAEGIVVVGAGETSLPPRYGFKPVGYPHSYAFKLAVGEPARPLPPPPLSGRPKEAQETDELLRQAARLADRGELGAAHDLCREYLKDHKANAGAHFILGLIEHARGDEAQALDHFNKVVYLKPDHYEALVYLALMHDRAGDAAQADRYRQRAARALESEGEHRG